MNVVVHFPKSGKDKKELANRVAAIQADAVISYLDSLPYSREDKLRLLNDLNIEKKN